MLNIEVIKSAPDKVVNVKLTENDIALIRDIRSKIGLVQAIKVLRLMTGGTLLDCKNYVDGMK